MYGVKSAGDSVNDTEYLQLCKYNKLLLGRLCRIFTHFIALFLYV